MSTAVFFALKRESSPFLRLFSDRIQIPGPCSIWQCVRQGNPILVLETGVGRCCTQAAFDWLLAQDPRPTLVVSAGFGGALAPQLRVGEVVFCQEVMTAAGTCWRPLPQLLQSPSGLQKSGRLITVDHLVTEPAEKQSLHQAHHADVIDMETAVLAEHCQAENLPLLCLRAISDEATTRLSKHLLCCLSGAGVRPWRLAWTLMTRPWFALELMRLARATRKAAAALATTLREVLASNSK